MTPQLKAQKVEADAYAAKAAAREAERVQFALWKLFHLESRVRVGEKTLSAARVALTEAAVAEGDAAAAVAELGKKLAKAQKEVRHQWIDAEAGEARDTALCESLRFPRVRQRDFNHTAPATSTPAPAGRHA